MTLTTKVSMTPTQIENACRRWMREAGYSITKDLPMQVNAGGVISSISRVVSSVVFTVDVEPVKPPPPEPPKPGPTKPTRSRK